MPESYAVIGGEGFLGSNFLRMLCERYPSSAVVSLDLVQRNRAEKQRWTFEQCDLTELDSLVSAFERNRTTTVFHTASPWTGAGKDACEKVNIVGTQTVIDACKKAGVKKLVYTSSAGVVFDGRDIINVDERASPPEVPMDHYNDTKARAEAMVIGANGQDGLLTCAIRPAGIFGPGDRQGTPGFIDVYKTGKAKFSMGDGENSFDWTYVDNIIHGHLLAAEKLADKVHVSVFDERTPVVQGSLPRRKLPTSETAPLTGDNLTEEEKKELDPPLPAVRNRFDQWFDVCQLDREKHAEDCYIPIAGQVFYVTNGEPVPFWSWARAIWYEYAKYDRPLRALPGFVGLAYAGVLETIGKITGRPSLMTPAKVKYSIAKRYYNIEKARRLLGYEPIVGLQDGLERTIAWYKQHEAETAGLPPKQG